MRTFIYEIKYSVKTSTKAASVALLAKKTSPPLHLYSFHAIFQANSDLNTFLLVSQFKRECLSKGCKQL